jgi:hypothetical protein
MFTRFDFVATQILFSLNLFGRNPLHGAILFKLHPFGSIHGIFGRVIMALLASLAYQSDNFSLFALLSHIRTYYPITDKNAMPSLIEDGIL